MSLRFCYLGDMLSIDGDANAALEARIRKGLNKLWQLVPLLTNRDVCLLMRGKFSRGCVQNYMLHRNETRPVK